MLKNLGKIHRVHEKSETIYLALDIPYLINLRLTESFIIINELANFQRSSILRLSQRFYLSFH